MRNLVCLSVPLFLLMAPIFEAHASLQGQAVEYQDNGVTMEGYLAYDLSTHTARPGILIIPDWMGLGDFAKQKADQLAKEGNVAFAVDIYGKGVRPKNTNEASQLAEKYKNDRHLLRSRIRAAFDKLSSIKEVDSKKIVVIGYCFGGTAALELARSGAPLAGTVTFHGGLSSPTLKDAKNIHGKVLVLHGADDPFVPPSEVEAFKNEMKSAGVQMEFISYPGAVHAFTNPVAGNDNSKGAAYNAEVDKESWETFENFLKEITQK
jgi:dienelactone hydrolase